MHVETSSDDIVGLNAAAGVLTVRGGMTSHAAVVARGIAKPAVVGCGSGIVVDEGLLIPIFIYILIKLKQ